LACGFSTSGSRYWFHCPRKLKTPIEINPGLASGSMIRKNVPKWPAPSMNAASASSLGSDWKNAVRKNTENGNENAA